MIIKVGVIGNGYMGSDRVPQIRGAGSRPGRRDAGRDPAREAEVSGAMDQGAPRSRQALWRNVRRLWRSQAPGMAGRALHQGHSDKHPLSHRHSPDYENLGCKAGEFPYAEQAAAEQLSLPMYPEVTADVHAEVAAVIELRQAEERG
jgi:hypothetical protein